MRINLRKFSERITGVFNGREHLFNHDKMDSFISSAIGTYGNVIIEVANKNYRTGYVHLASRSTNPSIIKIVEPFNELTNQIDKKAEELGAETGYKKWQTCGWGSIYTSGQQYKFK